MESFSGWDKDSAGRTSGNGFYYLMVILQDFIVRCFLMLEILMIDQGFTYCIPPFMIRSDVVTGVMSFAEMDAMMYKSKEKIFI